MRRPCLIIGVRFLARGCSIPFEPRKILIAPLYHPPEGLTSSDFGVSTGLISQGYWEMSKWYFVNVERGNIADKLQPRDINVSFSNNSNVPVDVIIFTFYSDQLTIDVETGIVTK
jgi:hypothetical protein